MKIAILGFAKIKYMPYMHFYLDQLDMQQHEVHLLYWRRDSGPDATLPQGITGHSFDYPMSDDLPLRKKLPGLLGYSRFARKTLKELKPELLIVLCSTTAVCIYPQLMGKYKGRYIFDFRDVTYEKKGFYRKAVANIVKHSALSFTSSDGFRKFLPDTPKLLTSHNVLGSFLPHRVREAKPVHTPIRVAFWGLVRHKKVNQAIIDKLGGDSRFELHYYGRAQGIMLEMVEEAVKVYPNVFFHGEYRPEQVPEFAEKTDLLHNIYDNGDSTMPYAMANKYYEGLMFCTPILSSEGSLMGSLCTQKGIGLACDPMAEDFADRLYEYYVNLNGTEFAANCEAELQRVLREVDLGNAAIRRMIK